jgi:predicted membrane channel-forming protein YqfA (hemolysin III family)
VVFFLTLFYPLPLCEKKGSNFCFWTGIVFLTGQVIFFPEWPKESLLICNWPHSVGENHFIVMKLFNRDSAIQKCFQKILHSLQVRKFGSLPTVRATYHTVRTPSCP